MNEMFDYFFYVLSNDTFFLYDFVNFETVSEQLYAVLNARKVLTQCMTEVAGAWAWILVHWCWTCLH